MGPYPARNRAAAGALPRRRFGNFGEPRKSRKGHTMSDVNTVVITGRLVRAPELRATPGGTQLAELAVAVNEWRGDGKGGGEEVAHFFDVTVWTGLAEACAKHLSQGQAVTIHGRLRQEKWTDKESGKARSRVSITGETVIFGAKAKAS